MFYSAPANLAAFRLLLAVVCLGTIASCGGQSSRVTYHIQLVRGCNNARQPEPRSLAIGATLAAHLRPVFSMTHYWEITRKEVSVSSGRKIRVRLSGQREVEIDLTEKGKRTVVAFSNGQVTSRVTQPIGEGMTIIGGDRDKETAWFIVVRRDKPPG